VEQEGEARLMILTDELVLRAVTEEDISEIGRMWNGGVDAAGAQRALKYMTANHERNVNGPFYHLCLAVCKKDVPQKILGWCGLDGKETPEMPELFVLLDEDIRGKGYGTQCTKALLEYAVSIGLSQVHGSCHRDNIASARMMEKAGMRRYGTGGNGAPLFRYKKSSV